MSGTGVPTELPQKGGSSVTDPLSPTTLITPHTARVTKGAIQRQPRWPVPDPIPHTGVEKNGTNNTEMIQVYLHVLSPFNMKSLNLNFNETRE